jgi:hypothetical protein
MLHLILSKIKLSLSAPLHPEVPNFFYLTGEKGSGKTTLIETLIRDLKCSLPDIKVLLAQHPPTTEGARSLYWALTNGEDPTRALFDWTNPGWSGLTGTNLLNHQVLIIDNVNSTSDYLFDHLNRISQKVRNCNVKCFGGLTVLCSGDMLDLPPGDYVRDAAGLPKIVVKANYPFLSKVWKENSPLIFYLKGDNHKFNGDELHTLRSLRYGDVESLSRDVCFLRLTSNDRMNEDNIGEQECYIVPFNMNAKETNNYKLATLERSNNRPVRFDSEDQGDASDSFLQKVLLLLVGIQVVFIRDYVLREYGGRHSFNANRGTLAKVASVTSHRLTVQLFGDSRQYLVERIWDAVMVMGSCKWSRKQYPLMPAFSLTVRQAQSLNLQGAILDMSYLRENSYDEMTTRRMARALVYSAVGSLATFSSLKAIKGVTSQLSLLSVKLEQNRDALIFDRESEGNCELMKELARAYPSRNPTPVQPVPNAGNQTSVIEGAIGVFTQQLAKLVQIMQDTNSKTNVIYEHIGSSQRQPSSQFVQPARQSERAQYTNYAATHWNSAIPTAARANVGVEIISEGSNDSDDVSGIGSFDYEPTNHATPGNPVDFEQLRPERVPRAR